MARQEGIVFRHVLRLILLCAEFSKLLPQRSVWRMELDEIGDQLTDACRAVDPKTTERTIESAEDA